MKAHNIKRLCILCIILISPLCTANDAGNLKSALSELQLLLDSYDNTKAVLTDKMNKLEHEFDEAQYMALVENMYRINRIEAAIQHCLEQLKLLIPQLDQALIEELLLKQNLNTAIPD